MNSSTSNSENVDSTPRGMGPGEWRTLARIAAKLALLGALCAAPLAGVLALRAPSLPALPWETDARLPGMPTGAHVGAIVLGSSRGYVFARFSEHARLAEACLGRSLYNAAMPSGGGVRPARLYLEEFLARGNRADAVLYFLDPFVLFSPGPNDAHKFVYFEPVQAGFLWRLLRDGYPPRQILTYVRSKFTYGWLFGAAEPLARHDGTVPPAEASPENIALRIGSLYRDGAGEAHFLRYARDLDAIVARCAREGVPLYIAVAPTLLGPEPGSARLEAWLDAASQRHRFVFRDFTDALPDPSLFYNLDHLNTRGVERFLCGYVRPLLDGGP